VCVCVCVCVSVCVTGAGTTTQMVLEDFALETQSQSFKATVTKVKPRSQRSNRDYRGQIKADGGQTKVTEAKSRSPQVNTRSLEVSIFTKTVKLKRTIICYF